MKPATGEQIKKAIAFSLLVHAALFCLVLFMMRLSEYSFSKQQYITVGLILPSGSKAATTPGSNRPQTAIHEGSRKPAPPHTTGPADQYETQTAMQSLGKAGAAGPSETDYQPFYKLGKMPSFKSQKTPVYPLAARTAGVETRVVVEVYISDQGKVDDVKLIKSGGPGFDQAVIEAVRGSSFEPGMQHGKTIASKVQIPYVFKLK